MPAIEKNGVVVVTWNAMRYNLPTHALRINPGNPDEIETSGGASFPTAHGRRGWRMLRHLVENKGQYTYTPDGVAIHCGDFRVDSFAVEPFTDELGRNDAASNPTGYILRAGCHVIQWAEVEALAKRAAWTAAGE